MDSRGRVVIWIPTAGSHGWDIERSRPDGRRWIGGGLRTMHELAVAAASTGRSVEMRGVFHPATLDELCDPGGARPELPDRARPLTAEDIVIVPEGIDDPAIYARLSLSPARVVLMVLGPPGLIGWSFVPGWTRPDPLTVDVDAVARPEHFRGAAALGFELWTHTPGIAKAAAEARVECRVIGSGRPAAFPDPARERDIDVVTILDNRWAPLAEPVARELTEAGIDYLGLTSVGNDRLLAAFGRARILLHLARIEGCSRIGCEARAMGAVPVAMKTNRFAVGFDEAGGAVTVATPAEMAGAVRQLLDDRARLEALSDTAMASARLQVEWAPYVSRVDAALASPREDGGRAARATIGVALRHAETPATVRHDGPHVTNRPDTPRQNAHPTQLERSLEILNAALVGEREELRRHQAWLESINASMTWRLTAPLRSAGDDSILASGVAAAKRALERRREKRTPGRASAVPPPAGFFDVPRGQVDTPSDDELVPRAPVRMVGWCLFPDSAVARVDVVVDAGPATAARLGIERPDVGALTGNPAAPVCGFELIVDLALVPLEKEIVTLETVAHSMDGSRLRLGSVTLTLGAARPDEDEDRAGRGALLRARSAATAEWIPGRIPGTTVSRPLRVLAFSHELSRSGASLYLSELLRRLAAGKGFEFSVISLQDGPLRDELEGAGIPVHVTNGSSLTSIDRYEGHQAEMAAWLAPQEFDVALINTLGSFAGADLVARAGIPFVWSIHESIDVEHFWVSGYPPGTPHPYVRARAEAVLDRAAALVFPARATERLFASYAAPDRLVTHPYGIELPEIDTSRRLNDAAAIRRGLGIGQHATVILCLGSIEARKSQTMLALAFAEVAGRHPDALLLFVGKTGSGWSSLYAEGLEEYLSRAAISERVRVEPISDDPFTFHAIADLLVCASDLESLPRSIVEAMAFETPVLSTDVFGVRELIEDRRTGFLSPTRDAASLARDLDTVLGTPPQELRAVGLAASRLVRERHEPARRAGEMADLLRGLAADPDALPAELLGQRGHSAEPSITVARG